MKNIAFKENSQIANEILEIIKYVEDERDAKEFVRIACIAYENAFRAFSQKFIKEEVISRIREFDKRV